MPKSDNTRQPFPGAEDGRCLAHSRGPMTSIILPYEPVAHGEGCGRTATRIGTTRLPTVPPQDVERTAPGVEAGQDSNSSVAGSGRPP